ncbi:MAG: hypothetical protein II185_06400 [Firmicutes bacterium]|jgi:hypothetical protein|nr:hypothetical protein [Bacillota bacterium]
MLEETYPLIKQYGAPKAIIRWANVDGIEEDRTTIEGVTFRSKVRPRGVRKDIR